MFYVNRVMYSGCEVIYGVEVTGGMMLGAMGYKLLTDNAVDDMTNDAYSFVEMVNEWLHEQGYTVMCHKLRCCAHRSNYMFYIGHRLGEVVTAYRTRVKNYDDYTAFHQHMADMLQGTKNEHKKYGKKVAKELNKLFPRETVKIYTYANDCDSCT